MTAAIEVSDLGKRYRLGADAAAYDTLRDALRRSVRGERDPAHVWALRDLSFAVERGEALGVIGRNGAGKTTLLKVLAGITPPTTGQARTRGRVGALLEVGTGFHPELTGRENIYLNGAILGLRRAEIAHRFDAIVDFSGVARFLDTPVKRYSSGMRLRLAFAVAAHIEPPILVVDEVLAVGDATFRDKCLGKIAEIGRNARTVLFVSHDLGAITRVCSRAIWLEEGRLKEDGPARAVMASYLESGAGEPLAAEFAADADARVSLEGVAVLDASGGVLTAVRRDLGFAIQIRFAVRDPFPGLDAAILLTDEAGVRIVDDARSDWAPEGALAGAPGRYVATVAFPPVLTPGRYAVEVWIGSEHETGVQREVLVLPVEPRRDDPQELIERPRAVQPRTEWTVTHESSGLEMR
jgi:ABC-2 type transport system ATP-binding protein/lipopolysaccharide transport system ATP-binding protein